ncbi:MAG: tetratricopeptide repeat protein, partial [Planctomycetes bacterium]|nr:tetratricopeptide repeat protein [Planctomycetota bacterium]
MRLVVSLVLVLGFGSVVWGQGVGVALQEGIYKETSGDLAGAKIIYGGIIENQEASDTEAATAMYRLGMCLVMTGEKEKAIDIFAALMEKYYRESSVVGKAKQEWEKLTGLSAGKEIYVNVSDDLQAAIDGADPNDTVILGKGIYKKPVTLSKGITLKGESRKECIFEVTANQGAISIHGLEQGKAKLENLTIKWQVATSDPGFNELGAVDIFDSMAEIEGCFFKAVGIYKRV